MHYLSSGHLHFLTLGKCIGRIGAMLLKLSEHLWTELQEQTQKAKLQ